MSEVFTKTNMLFLLQGIKLTLIIAFVSIVLSFIFGTILAVLRNFSKGILGRYQEYILRLLEILHHYFGFFQLDFLYP